MAFEEIVKQVAETIQKEANVRAVFAEATKLDTHIVVPVATVTVSIGGGGTGTTRKTEDKITAAGGGGVNVICKPVGFIHEKDGQVIFTTIEHEKGLPAMAERLLQAFAKAPPAEKH